MVEKGLCVWPGFAIQFSLTASCGVTGVHRAGGDELTARLRAATYRRHAGHTCTAGLRARERKRWREREELSKMSGFCYKQLFPDSWQVSSPCWLLWRHKLWSSRDSPRCYLSKGSEVYRFCHRPGSRAYMRSWPLTPERSTGHSRHNPSVNKHLSRKRINNLQIKFIMLSGSLHLNNQCTPPTWPPQNELGLLCNTFSICNYSMRNYIRMSECVSQHFVLFKS